jgi:hypothetical protein
MILVQNSLSKVFLGKRFRVLCLSPFLLVRPGERLPLPDEVLNHEHIHVRQQLEMGWVFFFVWYGFEFLIRLAQHRDRYAAYQALSHEKEAHQHETDLEYLKSRNWYAWTKYLAH